MSRTAQRSAARPAPADAAELIDRTGILAASLPKRRRSPENEPEPAPIYTRQPVCDQDLRPKSVVIRRRRSRLWLGGAAAFTLLAIGWLGGGMLGGLSSSEDAASLDSRPAVATQPAPAPAPPAAPVVQPEPRVEHAPPVTVYVPVPAPAPRQVPVAKLQPRPAPIRSEEPRAEVPPSTSSPKPKANPVQDFVKPFMDGMDKMMFGQR
ncbi:hypothetical protein ACFWY9_16620 [Amycolatopsis sp. NPDC059027]|uniref:hypothetical protein n=1 Tax=Amycolatopsis sp. NPDC059027 TaxID=3346709 RepID=UPI00367082D3